MDEFDTIIDSYMSKEDLIKMIENLEFQKVRLLRLEVITGIRIKEKDNGYKEYDPVGYDITIE